MSQLQIFAPQQNWRKQVVDRLGAGTAALATTATDGFCYIPTCAGPPTGTPVVKPGLLPIVIDSTDNTLYFYSSGSWHSTGSSGPTYHADAVAFDGATWLINAALASVDSGVFSCSFWVQYSPDSPHFTNAVNWVVDPEDTYLIFALGNINEDGDGNAIALQQSTFIDDDTGTTVNADANPAIGTWCHVLIAVNLAGDTPLARIYLNDVDQTQLPLSGMPPVTMLTNGLPLFVGGDGSDGNGLVGSMSDVWIAPNVDLLVDGDIPEATRRVFISASGKPVDPAGFPSSAILFSGDATTFATNQGTGGSFTTAGALTNASTSPSD